MKIGQMKEGNHDKTALATISETSWKDTRSAQKMSWNSPLYTPPSHLTGLQTQHLSGLGIDIQNQILNIQGNTTKKVENLNFLNQNESQNTQKSQGCHKTLKNDQNILFSVGTGERQWALIQSLKLENVRVQEVVRVLTATNDLLRKELTMKERQISSLTQLLEVADAGCMCSDLQFGNGGRSTPQLGLTQNGKFDLRHASTFNPDLPIQLPSKTDFLNENEQNEINKMNQNFEAEREKLEGKVSQLESEIEDLKDLQILHESDLEQKSEQVANLISKNEKLNLENKQLRAKALELREELEIAKETQVENHGLAHQNQELRSDLEKAKNLLIESERTKRIEHDERLAQVYLQLEQKIQHVRALERNIEGYKEYVAALEGRGNQIPKESQNIRQGGNPWTQDPNGYSGRVSILFLLIQSN